MPVFQGDEIYTLKIHLFLFQNTKQKSVNIFLNKTLKHCPGVQWGQSYLMGRRFLFSIT